VCLSADGVHRPFCDSHYIVFLDTALASTSIRYGLSHKEDTMLRSLTLAAALAAVLLVPTGASADRDHRLRHFRGHFHGHNFHGYHSHARHFWGGRWWGYGVGSCWQWSDEDDEFVWDCD
jgi:hypothetical protein